MTSADDLTDRWAFLRALRACRLFGDRQVDDLLALYPNATADDLRERLMRAELLTPWQLQKLDAGQTDGLVLGPYHLLRELGKGGFGQVYLARHALMGRTVALKTLGETWANEPAGREYFLREVVGGTKLHHPHIAIPFDAGEENGRMYLAIEYVDGPTLDGYVTATGPLRPAEIVAVLAQTAEALAHASERGVIHRDLKPANILLAPQAPGPGGVPWTVKVIDFGLARFQEPEHVPVGTIMCDAGAVVGTPSFMPPEQIGDVHDVDVRSDLYSLGGTAYFAATGRLPFSGRSTQQIINNVLTGRPIPIDQLQPDLPLWLVRVIERLLERNAADRFQTPAELIAALQPPEPFAYDPLPAVPELRDAPSLTAEPPDPTEVSLALAPTEPAEPPEDFAPWWQEWHRLVGRLVEGQKPDLSDREYKVVQRTLLKAIRGAAPEWRPKLAAAVEPWVSLNSLTALDRRTLGDVWAECRKLDAAVGGRKKSRFALW